MATTVAQQELHDATGLTFALFHAGFDRCHGPNDSGESYEPIRTRGMCMDAANALDTLDAWMGNILQTYPEPCSGCWLDKDKKVHFCDFDASLAQEGSNDNTNDQLLCVVSVSPSPPPPSPPLPAAPPPSPSVCEAPLLHGVIKNLAPGPHTVTLEYKVASGTAFFGGAGTIARRLSVQARLPSRPCRATHLLPTHLTYKLLKPSPTSYEPHVRTSFT